MRAYYEDRSCTIYHGEESSCPKLFSVIDCDHENIYRSAGKGNDSITTAIFTKQRIRRTDVISRTAKRIQANSRAYYSSHTDRRGTSRMEGKRCITKGWTKPSAKAVCQFSLCNVREQTRRATPHRRKHAEQFSRERRNAMQAVSHAEGWAA